MATVATWKELKWFYEINYEFVINYDIQLTIENS